MWPSAVPEKTTPGIKVAAADCALVQRCAPQAHFAAGAGVRQSVSPVAIFTAERPGLRVSGAPKGSTTGTYTVFASIASMLPRNVQHSYLSLRPTASSTEETGTYRRF